MEGSTSRLCISVIDPVASARYSSFVPSIEYRLIAVGKGGRLSLYNPHQSLDGAPNPCHIRSNGRCQSISPAVQSIGNRRPSVVVTLLFYSFMVQSKPWVMHHTHPGLLSRSPNFAVLNPGTEHPLHQPTSQRPHRTRRAPCLRSYR